MSHKSERVFSEEQMSGEPAHGARWVEDVEVKMLNSQERRPVEPQPRVLWTGPLLSQNLSGYLSHLLHHCDVLSC